jgi:hypothetical protein
MSDLDNLYKAFLATILRDEGKRDDLLEILEERVRALVRGTDCEKPDYRYYYSRGLLNGVEGLKAAKKGYYDSARVFFFHAYKHFDATGRHPEAAEICFGIMDWMNLQHQMPCGFAEALSAAWHGDAKGLREEVGRLATTSWGELPTSDTYKYAVLNASSVVMLLMDRFMLTEV